MEKKRESEERNTREALLLEKKKILRNLVLLLTASFVVLIGALTMAWFSRNQKTNNTSMGVNVQAAPYTIQTRSSSGVYADIYETLGTGGMEWKISSDYNFENHEDAVEAEETEPGLEPGDSGVLEFRVNPNYANSITVDCVFDVKAYLETPAANENDDPVITEIDDVNLLGYVNAHVMLFAGKDEVTGKYTNFIDNDVSLRRVLEDQYFVKDQDVYVKIYWVWPKFLENLTSSVDSNLIYSPTQRTAIIDYIATNKDGFFKDCNDSADKVKTDLLILKNSFDNTIFNHYNMKYDNADLEIGNNVSYVLLSLQVE